MIDVKSLAKRWNETGLRDIAILPTESSSRPWPMFGMLAVGLLVGAAIGGYAVSQRNQLKRLAKRARRMSDDLAAISGAETDAPTAVTSNLSNHRRKSTLEVSAK